MGLFSKLSQLKNAAKAGGNYGFIAQNVASIYYAIPLTPFGKTISEDQRLFATGLIDAAAYINNGSLSEEDIKNCVFMASSGKIRINLYAVDHKDMFDFEENDRLVGFTMQLEALIFHADFPKMNYRDVVNSVVQKKQIIASSVNRTLRDGSKSNIFREVMTFTTSMMSSPDFQNIIKSYNTNGENKQKRRNTPTFELTNRLIDFSKLKLHSDEYDFDDDGLSCCFTKHFTLMTGILSQSRYKNNPIIVDLFVSMLSAFEFIADYYKDDHSKKVVSEWEKIVYWFLAPFHAEMSEDQFSDLIEMIEDRRNLYISHSYGDNLRGDFVSADTPAVKKNWPPFRYGVILCDCINNPDYILDYDHAPVLVSSVFDHFEQFVFFQSLMDCFEEYTNDIKEQLIYFY